VSGFGGFFFGGSTLGGIELTLVGSSDSPAELELIRTRALEAGADAAVVSNHWALGGAGAKPLAEAVVAVCEESTEPPQFKFLYELDVPIVQKIETIAKEIYRADGIELSELAKSQVENYEKQGYGNLPSASAPSRHATQYTDRPIPVHSSLHGQDAVFLLARSKAKGNPNWSVNLPGKSTSH
jgi:hypothetical protein